MTESSAPRRPLWVDGLILLSAAIVFVTMVALGNWQIQRLSWKLDLIERVKTRAFQPASAIPADSITADAHEYLRVAVTGTFLHDKTLRVKALTDLGAGHWVMTPMQTSAGPIWINRGFAPSGIADTVWTRPAGEVSLEGLLRMTEPGGTFLERNAPDANRWVSRDIEAMSISLGLEGHRAFFIDADHAGATDAWPRGGLTKLAFRNSHLSYALTWYAMAALFFGAMIYVIYDRVTSGRLHDTAQHHSDKSTKR